jgi:hypothetical protein
MQGCPLRWPGRRRWRGCRWRGSILGPVRWGRTGRRSVSRRCSCSSSNWPSTRSARRGLTSRRSPICTGWGLTWTGGCRSCSRAGALDRAGSGGRAVAGAGDAGGPGRVRGAGPAGGWCVHPPSDAAAAAEGRCRGVRVAGAGAGSDRADAPPAPSTSRTNKLPLTIYGLCGWVKKESWPSSWSAAAMRRSATSTACSASSAVAASPGT